MNRNLTAQAAKEALERVRDKRDAGRCHISVESASAVAAVHPLRKLLRLDRTAVRASLRSPARIDQHDNTTSVCSFVGDVLNEYSPCGIVYGFGEHSPYHSSRVKILGQSRPERSGAAMPIRKFLICDERRLEKIRQHYANTHMLAQWRDNLVSDEFLDITLEDEIMDDVINNSKRCFNVNPHVKEWFNLLDTNEIHYDIALVERKIHYIDVILCLDLHGETLIRVGSV